MLESNRALFAGRPTFLDAIRDAPDRYVVEPTRSGRFTIRNAADDRRLFSQYDPLKEARRRIESEKIAASDLPVFLGFNPFMLEAHPARPAVVVERDPSLLKAVLAGWDVSAVLEGTVLVLDNDGHRLGPAVRNAFDPFRHVRVRVLAAPHVEGQEEWLRTVAGAALEIQRELSLNFMSYAFQLPMWIRTAMENLETWMDAPSTDALFGALDGGTAVIVGAGPSLERNVADLALFRDRAVVIAVDTALRRLDRAGIRPDIAVAVDANKANAKDVNGLSEAALASILVADQIASPAIVRAFRGTRAFLRCINYSLDLEAMPVLLTQPMDRLLAEIAGRSEIPSWQSGGSVSTNAFNLAQLLGAHRVIFVGQDLAYTGHRAHASGVGFEDDWCRSLDRFHTREGYEPRQIGREEILVPGWHGGMVRTNAVMREYLRWFEATFEHGSGRGMEIIDATEGGAIKRGTRRMTLREAAALPGRSVTNPGIILRERLRAASPTGRSGWRERLAAIGARARDAVASPETIETMLPLARWIALPAYMGSHDLDSKARQDLIRQALVSSAQFLAETLGADRRAWAKR